MRIARFLVILICVIVLQGFLVPDVALGAACPKASQRPKVQIAYEYGNVQVDHSLSKEQIQKLVDRHKGYAHHPETPITLGLTVAKPTLWMQTKFTYKKASGGYCVYLIGGIIEVGFHELYVYISNRYPRGSCQYNAIYAHEMEHVAANRKALKSYAPKIKKAMGRIIRSKPSILVHNKSQARAAYLKAFERGLTKTLKQFAQAVSRAHAKIDSSKSYRQVAESCPAW